jgi:hypothetical protein
MPIPTPFNNHNNNNHFNILRLNVRCPVCNTPYDLQKLRIIGERDQQLLSYIDCGQCSTALLSIMTMNPNGMTAHGLVTDLTLDEVIDWDRVKPVSTDDVLELHQGLEADDHQILTAGD